MLLVAKNGNIRFKFSFSNGSSFYDPLLATPAEDIYISIIRGQNNYGNVILPPISAMSSSYKITAISGITKDANSYIHPNFTFSIKHNLKLNATLSVYGIGGNIDGEYQVQEIIDEYTVKLQAYKGSTLSLSSFDALKAIGRAVHVSDAYLERISNSEYNFIYTIPQNLKSGIYTVVIKTVHQNIDQISEINFQVTEEKSTSGKRISGYEVNNGIVKVYTVGSHGFSTGDYVYIYGVSNSIDGNYYIANSPAEDQILFTLNVDNVEFSSIYPYGKISYINVDGVSPVLSGPNESTKISYRPMYDSLQPYSTNSILLLGHADGIELNDIIRISSIQEAVNLLSGDRRSPLLKGIFEAYNSGARDIFICATAPMSEYVDYTGDRLSSKAYLSSSSATPINLNFYEKYYERLSASYQVAKNYEFIDMIVPLETSIMNVGTVDFISQLAKYCNDFHNETGFVQIGIIGSRSNGVKDSDIAVLESNPIFKNKFTTYDNNNQISSDIGRFIIPIYGEINFDHTGFPISYAGTAAAAFAGTLSNTPVYNGMIRKRINSAYSLYGANLSGESLSRLDNLGINTIYRSRKANRGNPYEIYISNDYTLANKNSIFSKTPQIRLAAMVINEIKSIGYQSVGKFSNDKIISNVKSMLESILKAKAIRDYNFDAYADRYEKGVLVFDISLVSSLSLKNIKFSVSTGPGA
jgi:hypothetical protein